MRHLIGIVLSLLLIFSSNAIFIHPREMSSDITWLHQELLGDQEVLDIKRQGALLVTPTYLAVGESVYVTVESNASAMPRSLVMIDREGNWLDTRYDPLRTQEFTIPLDGLVGDYRFWLSGYMQTPQSGLGVITVEVYDPLPHNLRRALPLEVGQLFLEAVMNEDPDLAKLCWADPYADPLLGEALNLFLPISEDESSEETISNIPTIQILKNEMLFAEPEREGLPLRCLLQVEMLINYNDNQQFSAFWGTGTVTRYVEMQKGLEGWRLLAWHSAIPQEYVAQMPRSTYVPPVPQNPPQNPIENAESSGVDVINAGPSSNQTETEEEIITIIE